MSGANLGFNAGVALCLTLVVGAQMLGWAGRTVMGLLLLALIIPYGVLLSLRRGTVRSLRLPQGVRRWIERLVLAKPARATRSRPELDRLTFADGLSIVPLLAIIIIASVAMVRAAEMLGQRWGVSQLVIGTFVVASLTRLPNLVASVRLARQGRGTALSSEAFNSNSLNFLAGAYIPALFVSLPGPSAEAVLALCTLLALTAASDGIGIVGRGFGRGTGVLLVAVYAAYAAAALWLAGWPGGLRLMTSHCARKASMVRFAIGFAVVALAIAVLGFGGPVGVAVGLVKILFWIAVVIAVIVFVLDFMIFRTVT